MDIERLDLRWEHGTVPALRERPSGARAVVCLAHGAGKDMEDPLLTGVSGGLGARGIAVVRFNFPYREAGRQAPGSQKESEACYRAVAEQLADEFPTVVLGGKSYGGRIASHIVADGTRAAGLVFLGYPLHPPGKPDRLRDAHLERVSVPMLFCQGTRDQFAQPDLLVSLLERLPTAESFTVEGGNHSLRVKGRDYDAVIADLAGAVSEFVDTVS